MSKSKPQQNRRQKAGRTDRRRLRKVGGVRSNARKDPAKKSADRTKRVRTGSNRRKKEQQKAATTGNKQAKGKGKGRKSSVLTNDRAVVINTALSAVIECYRTFDSYMWEYPENDGEDIKVGGGEIWKARNGVPMAGSNWWKRYQLVSSFVGMVRKCLKGHNTWKEVQLWLGVPLEGLRRLWSEIDECDDIKDLFVREKDRALLLAAIQTAGQSLAEVCNG